jgi:hypothetical protein
VSDYQIPDKYEGTLGKDAILREVTDPDELDRLRREYEERTGKKAPFQVSEHGENKPSDS